MDKRSVVKALEEVRVELPGGLTSFRAADRQAVFPVVFGESSDHASRHGRKFRPLAPLKIVLGEYSSA